LDLTDKLTQDYQKFEITGLALAGADSVQVRVRLAGGANDVSDGSIFVDDAALTTPGGGGNGGISGMVWNDSNSNGSKDGQEAAIAGWVVYLDTNNNSTLDGGETTATTDASGNYTFSNLSNGTYHVKQQIQTGYRKTKPAQGTAGYDAVVN